MKNGHVAAILVAAILVVGGISYTALNRPSGPTTILNAGTSSTGGASAASCVVYTAQALQVHLQTLNNSKTPPAFNALPTQPINVYNYGGANPVQTGTSTSGSVAISGVSSCTNYTITGGDNTGNFLNGTQIYLGTATNFPVTLNILGYSAPTIQSQNATSSAFSTFARYHSATAGTVIGTLSFSVQAGTNYDGQNSNGGASSVTPAGYGMIVYLTYNSAAMYAPTINGAVPVSGALLNGFSPSYVTSNSGNTNINGLGVQNAYVAYYLPAGVNGQYSSPAGVFVNQNLGAITPQIQLKSSYGANEIVGIGTISLTGYYNTATSSLGGPGLKFGVALNPSTQSPIFTTVYNGNQFEITRQ